jgi:hypothetical protein
MTGTNGNGNGAKIGTDKVKQGLAQMLKGGVIVSSRDVSATVSVLMCFAASVLCRKSGHRGLYFFTSRLNIYHDTRCVRYNKITEKSSFRRLQPSSLWK